MALVLVIDDTDGVRTLVRRLLESAGHEVIEARDGREGVARFQAHRPRLVITDILMPEREGIETISLLRAESPNLPIIAISGGGRSANLDFLEIARDYGAAAVLAKPFRPAQLLQEVDKLLAGGAGPDVEP